MKVMVGCGRRGVVGGLSIGDKTDTGIKSLVNMKSSRPQGLCGGATKQCNNIGKVVLKKSSV